MSNIKLDGLNPSSDLMVRAWVQSFWKKIQDEETAKEISDLDLMYLREMWKGVSREYGINLFYSVTTKDKEKQLSSDKEKRR